MASSNISGLALPVTAATNKTDGERSDKHDHSDGVETARIQSLIRPTAALAALHGIDLDVAIRIEPGIVEERVVVGFAPAAPNPA